MADLDDIRERLAALGEELADLALERLREATALSRRHGRPGLTDGADDERGSGDADAGGEALARATAEERRITRARRAVERAVAALSDRDGDDYDG